VKHLKIRNRRPFDSGTLQDKEPAVLLFWNTSREGTEVLWCGIGQSTGTGGPLVLEHLKIRNRRFSYSGTPQEKELRFSGAELFKEPEPEGF
jgi:hypothetical protein